MNGYTVAFFFATVVFGIAYLVFTLTYYRQIKQVTLKYPLFAARDEFVRLKLEGYFDHDPELYEKFCKVCNDLIVHTRQLNFWIFLISLQHVDQAQLESDDFKARIKRSPDPVRQAEAQLWKAVLEILYENSTAVRLIMKLHIGRKVMKVAPSPVADSILLPVRQYMRIQECHPV